MGGTARFLGDEHLSPLYFDHRGDEGSPMATWLTQFYKKGMAKNSNLSIVVSNSLMAYESTVTLYLA